MNRINKDNIGYQTLIFILGAEFICFYNKTKSKKPKKEVN